AAMQGKVDERHLNALLGTAGKSIAALPGAKRVVARMKLAASPEDFAYLLQSVDLGLDEAARRAIWEAATDKERWRGTHAALVRSAEQQLIERFSPSS
ncbi:MAG TPA: hypothetical protein VM582_00355, partial [Candidatus Thermoplasmatota archaeon]|nr:hypothetical protein [Candidatus Thermoplasmatota archaeon]